MKRFIARSHFATLLKGRFRFVNPFAKDVDSPLGKLLAAWQQPAAIPEQFPDVSPISRNDRYGVAHRLNNCYWLSFKPVNRGEDEHVYSPEKRIFLRPIYEPQELNPSA